MIRLLALLVLPLAPALHYGLAAPPVLVFAAGLLGVMAAAEQIRAATEHLARHVGGAVGGLLTVSLGSLAELLLALFVLARGQAEVVHAQIAGSIIGTSLFGLGLAVVAGSVGRTRLPHGRERAGLLSNLLILVVIALLLPAMFDASMRRLHPERDIAAADQALSLAVSAVLLLLYLGNLVYTLVTHRDVFAGGENEDEAEGEGRAASWPLSRCLAVLAGATTAAALESELISGALEGAATALHLGAAFLGVIVLALVGTIADLFAAVWFARQGRMGLVMGLCIGSAIQIALVVAPLLVILSWLIGHPMTLVFNNPLHLFAIAGAAFIVNAVTGDGETTWFEGMLLIGIYLAFAAAFFLAG